RSIDSAIDTTGRNLLEPLDQIRDAVAVYGDYREAWPVVANMGPVSYTHLTLPTTTFGCRSRWSPDQ
uniref:hypothetical protein n=1 Tax=Dyella sp. ASV21 TaxID=2795114 RepID=UPI0018EC0E52